MLVPSSVFPIYFLLSLLFTDTDIVLVTKKIDYSMKDSCPFSERCVLKQKQTIDTARLFLKQIFELTPLIILKSTSSTK